MSDEIEKLKHENEILKSHIVRLERLLGGPQHAVSSTAQLSDEEVWLLCYCGVATPVESSEWSAKEADAMLEEFKARFRK